MLFGNLGYLTTYYVKKFLDGAKSRDERRALQSVSHKLKSLGIDVDLAMDNEPKVVVNLSSITFRLLRPIYLIKDLTILLSRKTQYLSCSYRVGIYLV